MRYEKGLIAMGDLTEVTRIVNELNDIESKKEGKAYEERLKLLDSQTILWKELYGHVCEVICSFD
ncbi:MAG: hypothetical protein EHM20_05715 [Alphaproteobacteria bacterium]|nr:MAG: hypothetical protein EHM20_05715 [Alphaproteobacteria bacterium]